MKGRKSLWYIASYISNVFFYFMAQIVFLKVILQIILPFTRKIIPYLYSFNRFVRVILLKLKTHCSNSNCLTKWGQLCYYHWKKNTVENQCVQHKWHINGKINKMDWNINGIKLFKFILFDKIAPFRHRVALSNEEIKI